MNDITSYENALNDGLYADGGTTNKKVYVSIRLDYSWKKMSEDMSSNEYEKDFYTYNDSNFIELKNQELKGVIGVSKSSWNIADWFYFRNALIVMDYNDFMELNNTTEINYDDPYQLMKDDCKIIHRLYHLSVKKDLELKREDRKGVYKNIFQNLVSEFKLYKNEHYNTNKSLEISKIESFLYPRIEFIYWLDKKNIILNSPKDLAERILEFASLPYEETHLDSSISRGINEYTLTTDEILPIVERGVIKTGQLYEDEQEIILNDKVLKIPKKSQLFFKFQHSENSDKKDINYNSNIYELIDKYKLKSIYSVNFISQKDLNKYREKINKKRNVISFNKINSEKNSLEIKKNKVINELLDYFLTTTFKKINSELNLLYTGDYYKDFIGDETASSKWNEIPEVKIMIKNYTDIVTNNFHSLMLKPISEININSFRIILDYSEVGFNNFLDMYKDSLSDENINYRGYSGYFLISPLMYELKYSLNDYRVDSEYISYKKLSEKYLKLIGSDLYRYYNKEDINLTYFSDGGELDKGLFSQIWEWFGIKF